MTLQRLVIPAKPAVSCKQKRKVGQLPETVAGCRIFDKTGLSASQPTRRLFAVADM
ncbi:hypothetical protein [Desulfopila aestuarii]|uniref:Uncharacterized protein n=1 Tax=Desulfopila aestuarii DSM 18488 TaxID=1121416 RepID=A0A1M7Y4P0_9BACT|nr:hypothetical protein [Desulfopila aestuarii]SHO47240.1 hypothetical protein SAMN02745220_01796 [Desulfopila aestuarii DSM 18488]